MNRRIWCLIWMIGVLNSSPISAKDDIAWDKLQGLGEVEYFTIEQPQGYNPAKTLHIFARLPDGYDRKKSTTYPTLYVLDAGTNFPLFASYYTHLRLMEDIPEMILIGISYGSNSFADGNTRGHDFTAPSQQSEHYGGAKVFDQFLAKTLMPEIEKKYAVNKKKQMLFGQSLGGQFALFSAMYGNAPFYAVIASNPAFHRNLNFFEQPLKKRVARPKAYIISAEFDAERFRTPARKWQKHWSDQASDWERKFQILPNHNHLSANPEAFRRGLKWIFQNE